MSRFGYIVSFVCCALVLGASVFTVCAELPDAMIEPKWYATGVAFIFVGIVWAVVGMVRPSVVRFEQVRSGFEAACVVVCALQAVMYLMQTAGVIVPYGRFSAGSFDNVAGLASCLGISLPIGMRWLMDGRRSKRLAVMVCKVSLMSCFGVFNSEVQLIY